MIRHVEMKLQFPKEERVYENIAYSLYGMLCEKMNPDLGDLLHEQMITPIRQNVVPLDGEGEFLWSLDLFNDALEIVSILEKMKEIRLNNMANPIIVNSFHVSDEITGVTLLEKSRGLSDNRVTEFVFETTTSFKVDGKYQLFPSTDLIAQSLLMRWEALMPEFSLQDEDAFQMICRGLSIQKYKLRSRQYYLKGHRIHGFVGSVSIYARLPAPMMEIWNLLVTFAPYSGIGIKTTLGMGSVKCSR